MAIGIKPAKTTIIASENQKLDGQIWVVNDERRPMAVKISVEGPMAEYIKVKEDSLTLDSNEEEKSIEFKINLPKEVPPGISLANILVEETLAVSGPNVVSSRLVLKHKVIIQGEYPEKYVEAKINFQDKGDKIEFVSEVANLGRKDLAAVQTTFYVNGQEQEEHTIETEKTALKQKETKLLKASLEKNLFQMGRFEVAAVTTYDDQTIELITELLVGKPDVEITYFDKYFLANQINQYSMDLLNKWNQEIKNVFVDVEVKKDDQKIDQFRTRSVDLEGNMLKRINDYLDARGKDKGKYTFDMSVNFWDNVRQQTKKRTFTSEMITEQEAKKLSLEPSFTGQAAASNQMVWPINSGASWAFMILVGILIIGGLIFWRYAHREDYE